MMIETRLALHFYIIIKTQGDKDGVIAKLINFRGMLSIKGLVGFLLLLPVACFALYVISTAILSH